MNIEEFYDQDARRRESEEIELGGSWHDAAGQRFVLSYVVDTGEVYLMSAPDTEMIEDPFGDIAVQHEPVEALIVDVIAHVPSTDELHRALSGWEDAMQTPSSVEWLRSRLSTFGAA
jgi:hypothetical protein